MALVQKHTRARVVPVEGYGGSARREPLEIVIHGPAGVGKTTLALTLPGPAAWVVSEPGATTPILSREGYGGVPRIVARPFNEFEERWPPFAARLPSGIEWVVVDTMSTLLVSQHALHLAEAERVAAEAAVVARARGREPPGLNKFAVYDSDLNRARRLQTMLQSADRNVLWLCHTNPVVEG